MPGHVEGHHHWEHHDPLLPVDPDLSPEDPGEPSTSHRPAHHLPRSRQTRVLAAIAAGGFLGSLARYEVGLSWSPPPGHFPWATFAINTSGALLLGVVLTLILEGLVSPRRGTASGLVASRKSRADWIVYLRPFACVGVIGSWTTMSTFALDADQLIHHGWPVTALVYAVATIGAGIPAAWLGIALARLTVPRVSESIA